MRRDRHSNRHQPEVPDGSAEMRYRQTPVPANCAQLSKPIPTDPYTSTQDPRKHICARRQSSRRRSRVLRKAYSVAGLFGSDVEDWKNKGGVVMLLCNAAAAAKVMAQFWASQPNGFEAAFAGSLIF